jgi:hypothetical protein
MKRVAATGKKKNVYRTVIKEPEGKSHLGELSVDGRMVGLLK